MKKNVDLTFRLHYKKKKKLLLDTRQILINFLKCSLILTVFFLKRVNKAYPLEMEGLAWQGNYRLALNHWNIFHQSIMYSFSWIPALLTVHHRIVYVCLCHLSDPRSQRLLVWRVQMSGWAGVCPSGLCVWQTAWLQWLQWWNELWWVRLHPHLSQKLD